MNNNQPNNPQQISSDAPEYWFSEYELRRFIHTATNWQFSAVRQCRTDANQYSIFEQDIQTVSNNYALFCDQLLRRLTENENWKAIELDVKNRFLPMINTYMDWYDLHADEIATFGENNPYKFMLSYIELTRREIFKYFPEEATQERNKSVRQEKTFPEYFAPQYRETLPEALKIELSKDKKTTIAVLICLLRKKEILLIGEGQHSAFHAAMTNYFSPLPIGNRKYHVQIYHNFETTYKEQLKSCEVRLSALIARLEKA